LEGDRTTCGAVVKASGSGGVETSSWRPGRSEQGGVPSKGAAVRRVTGMSDLGFVGRSKVPPSILDAAGGIDAHRFDSHQRCVADAASAGGRSLLVCAAAVPTRVQSVAAAANGDDARFAPSLPVSVPPTSVLLPGSESARRPIK